MSVRQAIAELRATSGIEVAWPEDSQLGFDPRVDFGRLESRTPAAVVRPANVDELMTAMAFFAEHGLAYKTRGAAHTSGGQVLSADGVVLETGRLSRILADEPAADRITVEGGATWLSVAEHLARSGRRPLGLTDNARTTVAGTLSVGGFTDSTFRRGLQIGSVHELTLVTPDGGTHRVGPGDELFEFALAGRGQLGVIARATLATTRASHDYDVQLMRWFQVDDFVRDAMIISREHLFDVMRARLVWAAGGRLPRVDATVGRSAERPRGAKERRVEPSLTSNPERINLLEQLRTDPLGAWTHATAALEFVLPLPSGLALWPSINQRIVDANLPAHFRRGAAIMVLPSRPRLPLAPLPATEWAMIVALRPHGTREQARAFVEPLRELGRVALDAGGALYMIGVEALSPAELSLQYGDALGRFRALKAQLDPGGVCNPGLL